MPTQTFPCPFCGKKMGVGIELLGKKVRCPHCNQILVAPAPAATAVPPLPVAIPVVIAPPPPPPEPTPIQDLPTFNIPSQEARESIFDEREDESDDVFSSSDGNKMRVPEMPVEETPPAPPPPPPPPLPVAVEPAPEIPLPPPPAPEPGYAPTVELSENPFAELAFEVPQPPVAVQPTPVPVPPPPPPPPVVVQVLPVPATAPVSAVAPIGATPPSSAGGNPWAGMDQLPAVALPEAVPTVVPILVPAPVSTVVEDSPFTQVDAPQPKKRRQAEDDAENERPAKRTRAAAPAGGGSALFRVGFFILAPYALIVTIAAIYGLFLKSSVPAGHPLSNLPDNFGEFTPAERKKSSKLPIAVDGELPADQKVALGGKLEIGQLEITPVGVEERRLKIVSEGKTGGKQAPEITGTTAIVLKMRIKNTSDDLMIQPLDPAFNRRVTSSGERIGTGLAVGKVMYWGGAIAWPFPERVVRRYEEAQVEEATPLKPGESRDYFVFTDYKQTVVKAVKDAREGLVWRVHVRRGRIDFDGKDIPVTAIIGVEFKSSDVKTPD